MIKTHHFTHLWALVILSLAACSESDDISDIEQKVGESSIALSVEDYIWESPTRTSATLGDSGLTFSWTDNDTISIYPDQGSQVFFKAQATEEGVSATEFDGGAWKLKKGHSFSAFYPFCYDNRYADHIQLDYTGQKQTTENISDACQKDYIYAPRTEAIGDVTNFQFKHLGAFMLLQLSMQQVDASVTFASVYLYSKYQVFPIKQELDLTGEEPQIKNIEYSNRLTVDLTDFSISSAEQIAKVAMFMPAISSDALSGREIYVKAVGSNGKTYISTEPITATAFKQGKAYKRTVTMVEEQEIYNIKVLAFGNSYTVNELMYTPYLLRELLPKSQISMSIMFIASATIDNHWDKVNNPTNKDYIRWVFSGGKWNRSFYHTYNDIMAFQTWDYVTFQQASSLSTDPTKCANITNLVNQLNTNYPNCTPIWTITHSYADGYNNCSSETMYNGIVSVAQYVQEITNIDVVIPYGTAIQNARQTQLNRLGGYGDIGSFKANPIYKQMTWEGSHLQAGLPCLVACYTSAQTILDLYGIKKSIAESNIKMSQSFDNSTNMRGQHELVVEGLVQDVTDEDYRIAKKCALDAIYNPFSITPQQ